MLTASRDTMRRRGPDGVGSWIAPDGKIGLGHCCLSILDLSDAAAQPMCSQDGRFCITFNGEIYNHADIRDELNGLRSFQWKTTRSDTEVILNAFEVWGIDCVERFRGMFAFAVWDARRRELWLVRDRMGIKPLYYSVDHVRITFASDIKALLEDPNQRRAVDEEAFYHYLSFMCTPPPMTLFQGIRKVPCAHWVKVSGDGAMRVQRYWDPWDHVEPLANLNEDEIAERTLGELRTTVKLCQVSDVPVGTFLSGGIDSSTITALAAESHPQLNTYTIGNVEEHDGPKNEMDYARLMAGRVGAKYHERLLSDSDVYDFLTRISLFDEPIADPVCISIYYVSKLAHEQGIKVCLAGDGSDELFWGYPRYKMLLRLQRLNDFSLPPQLKRLGLSVLALSGRRSSFPFERLRRAVAGIPIFWTGEELFTEAQKTRLLGPGIRSKFEGFSSVECILPTYQRFRERAWERSSLNWMTYSDLNLRLPECLLMRYDKMCMDVSLEARLPFLDHKVVELALGIPEAVKTRNDTMKYVLKKSVRGLVPDEIIDRKKGFMGPPLHQWVIKPLAPVIERELRDFCRETDMLDFEEVSRLLHAQRFVQLWPLVAFVFWWKTHILRGRVEF